MVKENLAEVKEKMAAACKRTDPVADTKLIALSTRISSIASPLYLLLMYTMLSHLRSAGPLSAFTLHWRQAEDLSGRK